MDLAKKMKTGKRKSKDDQTSPLPLLFQQKSKRFAGRMKALCSDNCNHTAGRDRLPFDTLWCGWNTTGAKNKHGSFPDMV
jgi:hypothetical protein